MVGQSLFEYSVQQVVKERDRGPCMEVEHAFIHHLVPVLLTISQVVEHPNRPSLLVGESYPLPCPAAINRTLHTYRDALALVEDTLVALRQEACFQQHLERVLEIE